MMTAFARRLCCVGSLCLYGCRTTTVEPPISTAREFPMIQIEEGSFVMGRDSGGHPDQRPAHQVTLSAFSIDATLVTVADFRNFVDQTGYRTSAETVGFGMTAVEGMDDWEWEKTPGASWRAPWGAHRAAAMAQAEDEPVVMVSWIDATSYCKHRGKRLPTEAEWEYAMRAGSEGTRFPWGNNPSRADGRIGLNFWQGTTHRADSREDGYLYLSPVRAFPPNDWGIYDPVGNAWQWVGDWYGRDTYAQQASGVRNPTGPEKGWARVARGGSWWCSKRSCSAYGLFARGKSRPMSPFSNNSFRCAR